MVNVQYQQAPLAGNSIHQDRKFIHKYMPKLDDYLSYKIIDVSTFKLLAYRWNVKVMKTRPVKKNQH